MTEIFKPRANMVYIGPHWECLDENEKLICDGGPSIISDTGYWEFYDDVTGYHRLEGPASSSGHWCINDEDVTLQIYQFAKENDIDLDNLSEEDMVMIALKFS